MAEYGASGLLPGWMFDERFGQPADHMRERQPLPGWYGGELDYRWGPENDGGKTFNQFDISGRYSGMTGIDPRAMGESVLMANDPNMPPPPFQAPQQPMGPPPPQQQPAPGWPNGSPTMFAGGSAMGYAQEPPRQQQPLANFPAQAPQQQSGWDRFGQGINDNAMTLMGLGAGIASGRGWGDGISQGLRLGMAGAASDRKQKNEASAQQAALQMVAGDTTLTPDMKQAIMRSPHLAQQYAESMIKKVGGTTDDLREFAVWQKSGGGKDLPPGTNLFEHFMTKVKQRETENFGLQPQFSWDPQTKTLRAYQLGTRGNIKEVMTPDGKPLTVKAQKEETATENIWRHPHTLEVLAREPKNVKEGAALAAEGKIQGPIRANMPKIETSANLLLDRMTALENHPGMKTAVGQFRGRAPEWVMGSIPGKMGEDYLDFTERTSEAAAKLWTSEITKLVNLGALSDAEGKRLTQSAGRLSTIKSVDDFKAAIKDIKDSVKKGLEDSRKIAGTETPAAQAPTAPSGVIKWGRDPKTGLPRQQ